jgi:cell division protein FtsI/penicillin-binding protein 2
VLRRPRTVGVTGTGAVTGIVGALLLASLLTACASSVGPSGTLGRYLSDWSHRDYAAMAELVARPPADFVSFNRTVAADLGLESATYRSRSLSTDGSVATASLAGRLVLGAFGPLRVRTELRLTDADAAGTWRVLWSPRSILSALGPGDTVSTVVAWPPRAPILGAGGAPLTEAAPMVTVGIEGSRITSPSTVSAALVQAGATAPEVTTALATASAHPQWFVPVFDVTEARYEQLKPTIYPVPGTVFQNYTARTAVSAGLAAHVVGSVGPITAQELQSLGPPYSDGDTVGQTGIEQAYERQLAGRPGGRVEILDAGGAAVTTVARFAAHPGTPVATTIDPSVQQAAEAALAGVTKPAALVALDPSTGAVLASVSLPDSDAFDDALAGAFPPGSTFKVVTSADLIEHGATPASPASCPPTITVGGETFHNFEGEAAASLTLEQAFAESCNAAFIGLAQSLPYPSFTTTAAQFGIGASLHLGVSAFGGKVPAPDSDAQRAATSIGQADVLVSPLAMATAAAAVESGSLHLPGLVQGAAGATASAQAPATALDPTVVSDLRTMMAAVVDSSEGTAAGAGLPAGTYGKTGTAEFGTATPPQTDAWFIGYRGNLAFAVLVVGGGIGGSVAAPLAAKFLDAVGSS